jgi:hypothetical protein
MINHSVLMRLCFTAKLDLYTRGRTPVNNAALTFLVILDLGDTRPVTPAGPAREADARDVGLGWLVVPSDRCDAQAMRRATEISARGSGDHCPFLLTGEKASKGRMRRCRG